jgi:hypothetical protein
MGCLGVLFALTVDEVAKLKSFKKDKDRLDHVREEIEDIYFGEHPDLMAETDKAWDAIHRALSDGDLSYTTGPTPLRLAIIGGEPLYSKSDYIMSLKTPEQVKEIAAALATITGDEIKRRYDGVDAKKYGYPKSDEDRSYTCEYFQSVASFYAKAASEGRFVLLTADQ